MTDADHHALEAELAWLAARIDCAIRNHFGSDGGADLALRRAPRLTRSSALGHVVAVNSLDEDARLVLCLAAAPNLRPALLDAFLLRNPHTDRRFTEFGGVTGASDGAFRPTLETAAFILAGSDLRRRAALCALLDARHAFQRAGLLELVDIAPGAGPFETPLRLAPLVFASLTGGTLDPGGPPGARSVARRLHTDLEWDDLALAEATRLELDEIWTWLSHPNLFDDEPQLSRHVRPGLRALFHGPPGTGKTLAAALLGKRAGLDVYRVDVSQITSKWVGETEKNLAEVFQFAERQRCVLFFDEADSVFGKRSNSSGGQDRYANLEVSYLLQRIEDFTGLVILATNIKGNIDDAFARRFEATIFFPPPDSEARLSLWRAMFPDPARLPGIDLAGFAERYDLTGGTIANVARHAVLAAKRDGLWTIAPHHLHEGVRREYRKAGKTISLAPR